MRSRWEGNGERSLVTGDVYTGHFRAGAMHGYGTMKYADGAVYLGNYHRGKRSGYGMFVSSEGSRYTGEWAEDRLDGDVVVEGRETHDGESEEAVARDALYERGERVKWLSTAISRSVTRAFIEHFCDVETVNDVGAEKCVWRGHAAAAATTTAAVLPRIRPPHHRRRRRVLLLTHSPPLSGTPPRP